MPQFKTKEGEILNLGKEGMYNLDNEKAFIHSLEKQTRSMDSQNQEHVSAFQENINTMSQILGVDPIPLTGIMDPATLEALNYFNENTDLLKQ